jgi:hypothetical protein
MLRDSYVAGNGHFLIRNVTLGQRVTTIRYTLRPSATPWDVAPGRVPGPGPGREVPLSGREVIGPEQHLLGPIPPGNPVRGDQSHLIAWPAAPPRRLTRYVLAPVIRRITADQNILFLLEVTCIQRKGGSGGGRRRNPVWPPLRFAVYLATPVTTRTPSCPAAIASAAFGAASPVGSLPIARGKIS